jgi:Holliday junction DNA helicase RuvB
MQLGMLARTPRGRCATQLAYQHLGYPVSDNVTVQQYSLSDMLNP